MTRALIPPRSQAGGPLPRRVRRSGFPAAKCSNSSARIQRSSGRTPSPLLDRSGGCALKKNIAKRRYSAQTGWLFKNFFNNHPVCATKVASRYFLDGASTPPIQEGRWFFLHRG